MKVWLIRAGKHGQDENTALVNNLAIIGWNEYPNLSSIHSREELYNIAEQVEPDQSKGYYVASVGQLNAFLFKIKEGDIVALPLKNKPQVALGYVKEPYKYLEVDGEKRHTRAVEWVRTDIPRTQFGQDLLYSLGAFMTVCQIKRNNAAERIKRMIEGHPDPGWVPSEELIDTDEEAQSFNIKQIAQDQIIAQIQKNFKGHALAKLIKCVLDAEGYVTYLSPPGPDKGIDILAAKGTFGFESPKLCVQVKSSNDPLGRSVLNELIGTMKKVDAEQGLLVSWGGFKSTTEKEAIESFFTIRLWDSEAIMKAVFKNYDRLPEEIQTALPLERIWMLVCEQDED